MKNVKFKRIISLLTAVCLIMSAVGFSAFADNDDIVEVPASEEDYIDSAPEYIPDGETESNADATRDDNAVAGGSSEDNKEVTLPAKNIRLKTSQQNKIKIGDTFQIQYKFTPLKSDDYVTYKSFDQKIVKVDENGLVTAVGYGKTKIRIKASSGVKKNIYFTVTDEDGNENANAVKGEVQSIELSDKNAMVRVGKQIQIEPVLYPLGISDELTYTSMNTSVVKVTRSGLVTAAGEGTTLVIVTASSGVSAEFSVTVYSDVFRGIDISKWQGDIDWKKVSLSGVDFAMIRSSFGSENIDEKLKANVAGCEKYGISYGFYHYTYAATVSEARLEARYFLNAIKNYNPGYPVVLDIEEDFYKKMTRKQVTDIIVAFMTELEKAGYYAALYTNPTFVRDFIDAPRISGYDIWIACWGDEERLNSHYDGKYVMWQYSATGRVNGISGDVDLDYSYRDYPNRG